MSYLIIKLIHLLAVIFFVGNIVIAVFWKNFAEKKKDRLILAHTFEGIIKADKVFTMPSVTILIIFGIGAALHIGYNLISTGWILWSEVLIIISGAAFMARVVPLQKKILALTQDEEKFNWDEYNALAKNWSLWGTIATVTPIIAIVLMVLKVPA